MKIVLLIDTSKTEAINFEDGASYEVSTILKNIARNIKGHQRFSEGFFAPVFSSGGKDCGFLTIYPEDGKEHITL